MGDMQDAAVLDTGAGSDVNAVHIAPNDGHGPNRAVGAKMYIANYQCAWIYIDTLGEPGGCDDGCEYCELCYHS